MTKTTTLDALPGGETETLMPLGGQDFAELVFWHDQLVAAASEGGPSRAFADIGSHLCDLIECCDLCNQFRSDARLLEKMIARRP